MAKLTPLVNRFELGMKQDLARAQMPVGSVWSLVDYVPRVLGAPIRKRGAWTWGSPLSGGGGTAINVFYAPYRAGSKLIKVLSTGEWLDVGSDSAEATISGSGFIGGNPFWFHRDKAITAVYGNPPFYWPGTGAKAPIAAAPQGSYGVVYKDTSVIACGKAGGTDYPQRVWFSAAGDPLTWDLVNSYIDASFPIRGIASLRNMILLFGDGSTERIIGSSPPVALDKGDMERGVAFNVGCIDARSIAYYGDLVIFANGQGIWRTDGSVPENLTRSGHLRRYWLDTVAGWTSSWVIAGGIIGDNYICAVTDQTGAVRDVLMLDLQTLAWTRFSNIPAAAFATVIGAAEELYFASRAQGRLGRAAPMFRPSASNGIDANGNPVLPVLETAYIMGDGGEKRWRDLYVNYVLDGSGIGTAPTFDVGVIDSPDKTTYTSIGTLTGQQTMRRDTLPIRADAPGVAFRLAQVLPSSDTRILTLEADVYPLEQSRVR